MKFTWFNLMPWPHLPDDFRQRYRSVWVDIPSELFDPEEGNRVYHRYMDQLEYADSLGFDGIGVNEHHQNGYGLMPSPNIIAAGLARRTSQAAICVIGNSIALYNPPIRVAEEFAMLDVISGGRLVAGFPVGTPMDTNFCYGQIPALTRDKYYEAHDLIMRAWSEREPFAFDGKYNQLRYVNCWPRPIQKPHPPIYIPGGGSIETWEWCAKMDYNYSFLSFGGYIAGQAMLEGFWNQVGKLGKDESPHRASFAQIIAVAETDEEAEKLYAEHCLYFFNRCLHVYLGYSDPPGYRTHQDDPGRKAQPAARRAAEGLPEPDLEGSRREGLHHRGEPEDGARALRAHDQEPARRARVRPVPHRQHARREDAAFDEALRRARDAEPARPLARVEGRPPLVDQAVRGRACGPELNGGAR